MIIAKGAEAVISREKDIVIKERVKKGYRLKEIDEKLRKRRTATEAKLLREARRAGVATPQVFDESGSTLKIGFIDGKKVKDVLNSRNCKVLGGEIGKSVALLHTYDIVHGDLTTSNMILKNKELYLIDFGLGFFSKRSEDKAVDLYLLHEALESTHFKILEKAWVAVLEAYKSQYEGSEKVIKALWNVEKRGRYRSREKTGH